MKKKNIELQQKKKPLIEELKKLKQTTENLFAQIKVYTKNPKVNPIILDEEKLNNYSYNEFIEKIQAATKVVKSMGDELARLQTFKQQLLAQVNNTQERIVQCELNLNEFPSHSSAKLNK